MSHRNDTDQLGPWGEWAVRLSVGAIAGAGLAFVAPTWLAVMVAIAIPALWWVVDNLGEEIVRYVKKIGR